jgi:hypothetical protein
VDGAVVVERWVVSVTRGGPRVSSRR